MVPIQRAHALTQTPKASSFQTDTIHVTANQGAWWTKLSEESNHITDDEIFYCGWGWKMKHMAANVNPPVILKWCEVSGAPWSYVLKIIKTQSCGVTYSLRVEDISSLFSQTSSALSHQAVTIWPVTLLVQASSSSSSSLTDIERQWSQMNRDVELFNYQFLIRGEQNR